MKNLVSTLGAAALGLALMSAAPALALQKGVPGVGPGNPSASGSVAAKPKEPSKKIVKQKFKDGKLVSQTVCTGRGQQYCHD